MVHQQDRQGWAMFLRRCLRKKNGKPHSYWALVESYRTARGSRQRLGVTEDGMPLGYEVFDGNTHDSKTLERIVAALEAKYGRAHRIWVVDRGMGSEGNLKFLRGQGASDIVGTPKGP